MNQSHKTFDQKLKTSPPQFPAPDVFEAKCHRVRGKGKFEHETDEFQNETLITVSQAIDQMPDNFKLISSQKVRAAPISGNIDNPEGGLDALMQVRKGDVAFLLCEKRYNNVGSVWVSPQGATTR